MFTEIFDEKLKEAKRYPEAFNKAEEEFENRYGFSPPYSSHDSYRKVREKKRNKVTRFPKR